MTDFYNYFQTKKAGSFAPQHFNYITFLFCESTEKGKVFYSKAKFVCMHILRPFLSLILRIEKGLRFCYIIDRKGDTNVQVKT